jgi:hypothetical protein
LKFFPKGRAANDGVDVARDYGYSVGSAITQIFKRLDAGARHDRILRERWALLREKRESEMSSVKS